MLANDLRDPLYEKAVLVIRTRKRLSLSLVPRHLMIGYNRTARLFETMEAAGVVSAHDEIGHRTVLPEIERIDRTSAKGGAA